MRYTRAVRYSILICLSLMLQQPGRAQITLDGTMGRSGELTGPHYEIGAGLGKTFGPNLFHSFGEFNLHSGQSATFSGPASIQNILSRVTGGRPSHIEGLLKSDISGANFFFLNPGGAVFGPNAQVDVSGSFVVSTADFVRLEDGGVFHAQNPAASILTSAPPSAFGFLDAQVAPISIHGSELRVGTRQALSLIGGSLQIDGATLSADRGKIDIVSAGSTGEVALNLRDSASMPTLHGFTALGNIHLDATALDISDKGATASRGPGGRVSVQGRNLTLDNGSIIMANNLGTTTGGSLDIQLGGDLSILKDSVVASRTEGTGAGASITVKAKNVTLDRTGAFGRFSFNGISADTVSETGGKAGDIALEAQSLRVLNGARISANTFGNGAGGNITLNAESIALDGQDSLRTTGVTANTFAEPGGGQSGNINVSAQNLQVLRGAEISTTTQGSGRAGDIAIEVTKIVLDGAGRFDENGEPVFTGIGAQTLSNSNGGHGGNIGIAAETLQVLNGATIAANTEGNGRGGNININAGSLQVQAGENKAETNISAKTTGNGAGGNITITADNVLLDGQGGSAGEAYMGIVAHSFAETETGRAGTIRLTAKSLQVRNGALITANTIGRAKGGDILINAKRILLDGKDSLRFTGIAAQTLGDFSGGTGGSIILNAGNIRIISGAEISASTGGSGAGGNITLIADDILLNGRSSPFVTGIAASTYQSFNGGRGGDILITARNLRILNGSDILGVTRGSGQGGSITLQVHSLTLDGQGNSGETGISAESAQGFGRGKGGDIIIEGGSLQIFGGARISAETLGSGEGGNITIKVDSLVLDARESSGATEINAGTSQELEAGKGGNIAIESGNLRLLNGGRITVTTSGSGQGGNIHIRSDEAALSKGVIASASRGNGDAGFVTVAASGSLRLANQSSIAVASESSNGGGISIRAGDSILVSGNSEITAQAGRNGGGLKLNAGRLILVKDALLNARAGGTGGNISPQARFVVLDKSVLNANAIRGRGGNISIRSDVFLPSIETRITASSEFDAPGSITIESPDSNIGGSLITLPTNLLGAENYLQERCAVRQNGAGSSFTVDLRRALRPDAAGLLSSVSAK